MVMTSYLSIPPLCTYSFDYDGTHIIMHKSIIVVAKHKPYTYQGFIQDFSLGGDMMRRYYHKIRLSLGGLGACPAKKFLNLRAFRLHFRPILTNNQSRLEAL